MGAEAAVAAVFEPVLTATTFEETVDRLGSAIRLGLLEPGTRLPPERELAEQLGISRSTLRQAITALVESGHLTSVRGRGGGTFVVPAPPIAGSLRALPADWHRLLDLRLAIEVGAVTLAAERIECESLRVMREAVGRMDAARDFDEYRRADARLHIAIAEGTGVPRLVALSTGIQSEITELMAHTAHPAQVLHHSNADHLRLIDALERHDGVRAVGALRRHLEGTAHIISGLMVGPVPPAR